MSNFSNNALMLKCVPGPIIPQLQWALNKQPNTKYIIMTHYIHYKLAEELERQLRQMDATFEGASIVIVESGGLWKRWEEDVVLFAAGETISPTLVSCPHHTACFG